MVRSQVVMIVLRSQVGTVEKLSWDGSEAKMAEKPSWDSLNPLQKQTRTHNKGPLKQKAKLVSGLLMLWQFANISDLFGTNNNRREQIWKAMNPAIQGFCRTIGFRLTTSSIVSGQNDEDLDFNAVKCRDVDGEVAKDPKNIVVRVYVTCLQDKYLKIMVDDIYWQLRFHLGLDFTWEEPSPNNMKIGLVVEDVTMSDLLNGRFSLQEFDGIAFVADSAMLMLLILPKDDLLV
ncbi:hypothetical protein VNO78_31522 [Psophocarpus tetragonolobus]|uniref:Uncharacterized protein n=1 Tax=Psophocarpus tetragonolobus TaxID=3891 RepID=A0AAN9X7M9_PSOTE